MRQSGQLGRGIVGGVLIPPVSLRRPLTFEDTHPLPGLNPKEWTIGSLTCFSSRGDIDCFTRPVAWGRGEESIQVDLSISDAESQRLHEKLVSVVLESPMDRWAIDPSCRPPPEEVLSPLPYFMMFQRYIYTEFPINLQNFVCTLTFSGDCTVSRHLLGRVWAFFSEKPSRL